MVKIDSYNFMAIWLEVHYDNPPLVKDFHVPVYSKTALRIAPKLPSLDIVFDSKIKDYINGRYSIKQIAHRSNVDIEAVKMLITHMAYYNLVSLVDIFSF